MYCSNDAMDQLVDGIRIDLFYRRHNFLLDYW